GLGAAVDKDLAHALDLRNLLRDDRVGGVVDLGHADLDRAHRQVEDGGVGRIALAVVRVAGEVGGELAAGGVDCGLDIAAGGVDVAVQSELQGDVGRAQRARGSHLGDTGDAAELALERGGDRRSHGLGTCAGQACGDRDGRVVNLGKRGDGEM